MDEFVARLGGTRVIRKILIANNGIGAVKAIRSIRRWAFEVFQSDIMHFVVMATPEDLRANAEYIRMASEVVDVPGGANNNNYANVSLIIELAKRYGVDAVWAGWGHASENPLLPEGLAETKIKFIGPSGGPMRALGDKIGSTIIAQSAGVPCIAWNGSDVEVDFRDFDGTVARDLYDRASVKSVEECLGHCERIGFPVMIKASEGGGGKGIRKVVEQSKVPDAYRQVASEIPGSPIFVMKLATKARHLEVQLLADEYGEAIALNGRDCSIQRRHQKIIEEGPPAAAAPQIWSKMEKAAVALAKAVGYANAGTVEYLFSDENEEFAFLELNPRLQVEHPVTEMITRANLPACQLMVAMGIPLHRIPDIRRLYGRPPYSTSTIDFQEEHKQPALGHCIAVRVTAENPDQGFQPTSGSITEVNFRSTPDVWGYFSVDSSGLVHEFADSQFGHLFASGVDREAARKSMIMALHEISIRGDIRTTVEYVAELLQSEDYVSNKIDTAWLDARLLQPPQRKKTAAAAAAAADHDHKKNDNKLPLKNPGPEIAEKLMASRVWSQQDPLVAAHAALIIAHDRTIENAREFVESLGKGHFPECERLTATHQRVELLLEGTKYVLDVARTGPHNFAVSNARHFFTTRGYVGGSVRPLADGGYLVTIGGRSRVAYAAQPPNQALRLILDRKTYMFELEYDPTTLKAESAGKLAKKLVPENSRVAEGQAYCEVEVMKMYLPLKVQQPGVLRWSLAEGVALESGDVIATVDLDNPDLVQPATLYEGDFEVEEDEATITSSFLAAEPPHVLLRRAVGVFEQILDGYAVPEDQRRRALSDFEASLKDPMLYSLEVQEASAPLRLKFDKIDEPDEMLEKLAPGSTEPVREVVLKHKNGRATDCVLSLVRRFLDVEREFGDGASLADVVARLRKGGKVQLERILDICRSRIKGVDRGALILELLLHKTSSDDYLAPALTELASLRDDASAPVALEARRLLIQQSLPSREELLQRISGFVTAIARGRSQEVEAFVRSGLPMRDVAVQLFKDPDPARRMAAVELYVHKIYEAHAVAGYATTNPNIARWRFQRTSKSSSDLASLAAADSSSTTTLEDDIHSAAFALFAKFEDVRLENLASESCLHIALLEESEFAVSTAVSLLRANLKLLEKVRRVTFLVGSEHLPQIFTFRSKSDFAEDVLFRHIEPPHAFYLDLVRLRNFEIRLADAQQTLYSNVHCYEAVEKKNPKTRKSVSYFVRVLTMRDSPSEAERMLVESLAALELQPPTKNNHVYLHIVDRRATTTAEKELLKVLCERYEDKLRMLGVREVELKITSASRTTHVVATNPTGYVLRLDHYSVEDGKFSGEGEWRGDVVTAPYVLPSFSRERAIAQRADTLYCYDYLTLFEEAVRLSWKSPPPCCCCEFEELERPSNDIGMVAWLAKLRTPEYPDGREIVLIANDITKFAGSFGTREDEVFDRASKLARRKGVPRVYVAANSGARIGLAAAVKEKFRVKWKNDQDPTEGFDYLYLDGPEHSGLKDAVDASIVTSLEDTPERLKQGAPAPFKLNAILGTEPDLGVENLRGSGNIAGESARAYRDIVTLTLVVGRSVGIGAYLVRLGHRTIQRATNSPIILTGYQALNKLLGKHVYNSNDQLGGPEIMYPNGVSHLVATDHFDVVAKALQWLSYIPEKRGAPLPISLNQQQDPVEREITWQPTQKTYDPRHLLASFFDEDSFLETLAGWAKTVVVGRARLGGIPTGVIITENRTAEAAHPADPADPSSSETVTPQAGGVWFPDSAHKTAQAIADFTAEDLPLFIFANWRGFSGGQRDMFDEILKFGAQIVDRLVAYEKPVFVYIPPLAELRGGAWVVVDPTINSRVMEMYAAETARGGVLEAEGLVEIKFRDIKKAMHRLDDVLAKLDAEIADARGDSGKEAELRGQVDAREKLLLPVYTSVAVHFADLHDTPVRMKAKSAIRDVVPWKRARSFFYWRLRRRLVELENGYADGPDDDEAAVEYYSGKKISSRPSRDGDDDVAALFTEATISKLKHLPAALKTKLKAALDDEDS
ncbi:hypothetical protein CTAYLR_000576 [Chrysophaeum taylorii]|uniref:Acetyl-CoA carboxylase n=1 Tax=Chrysophaeum taylorii TaxID=2483200 RepID=A0AAD7UH22_9STRA|nr:hypothetical protein CTAYLR_000576 [Chrysophaeum taylorii]